MMRYALGPALGLALFALGCRERRTRGEEVASFASVEPLLLRACAACHGSERTEGGVQLSSYYAALGCTMGGTPLVLPPDARAPMIAVLARTDHAGLLSESERAALLGWVQAGAPGRDSPVHGPGILDPRSDGWHGKLARADGFAALRDPNAEAVCGRCHEGAPARPPGVQFAAPGAPSCTSCHSQSGGVQACSTCHGADDRAYPPRDPCYFGAVTPDAHAAHVRAGRFRGTGLDCATCHPVPNDDLWADAHANGTVDLRFSTLAGPAASFAASSGACSVACHARAGRAPQPTWRAELALDCSSCHLSPPADHYPGVCARCHVEMGATPDALHPGALHLDGVVEVGSGSGTCGACHGEASDPWPRDAIHRAHRDSLLTSTLGCETCHAVPQAVMFPGHLDGVVRVQLTGRAVFAGRPATFDAVNKGCRDVACHAGPLSDAAAAPTWASSASRADDACGTCHRAPPAPPHIQQPACGGGLCHGAEVSQSALPYGITPSGRSLHIDGVIEVGVH